MSARPSHAPVDVAMMYAAGAVGWSRDYALYAHIARTSTGSRRCSAAAIAGQCKRAAIRCATLHNEAIKAIRGE